MSNFLAIATVTSALSRTLQAGISIDVPGAEVTTVRPDGPGSGVPRTGVNLYLYQVTPNAALRNNDLPARRPDGTLVNRPQAALELHYLLSFYGDEVDLEPQRLLGSTVRELHTRPVLTRSVIQSTVSEVGFLNDSDLADEVELVKLTPMPLDLEELSKLWSVFLQVPYTLSVAYHASVVLISGEQRPEMALPVEEPAIHVAPSLRRDTVQAVSPDALPELQLWLKADAGITYDTQAFVSRWADQSGNGNDATQSDDDAEPTFVRNALNGKPVVRFDGEDDYLAINNLHYETQGEISGITIFALVKSSSSNEQIIASFDRSEYWRLALKDDRGPQNIGWDTRPSTGGVNDLSTADSHADGAWHLIAAWFSAGESPDKQIFVDGEQVAAADAHGGNSVGRGTTRFGFIGVGSEAGSFDGSRGPLEFLKGDIAEFLIYHRALPDDERRQIERYFIEKYTG